MVRILLDDFVAQRKNIIGMILVIIPAIIIGYAFQSIYYCVGIVLTSGLTIIAFNTFFDYKKYLISIDPDEEKSVLISRRKLYVRAKYIEMIVVSIIIYIAMYLSFVLDLVDKGMHRNPYFSFGHNMGQAVLFPILFIFGASVIFPVLFSIKISKAFFISLAVFSILLSSAVVVADIFIDIWSMEILTIALPIGALVLFVVSYFASLAIAINKRS